MVVTSKIRKVTPTGWCWCGCGEQLPVGSFFATGHDKKAESAVIVAEYGGVPEFLDALGYGPTGSKKAHTVLCDKRQADARAVWTNASPEGQQILLLIADNPDIEQSELEQKAGISSYELRARDAALAKVAKKIGVPYPIRRNPKSRRFNLDPFAAEAIKTLARPPSSP